MEKRASEGYEEMVRDWKRGDDDDDGGRQAQAPAQAKSKREKGRSDSVAGRVEG